MARIWRVFAVSLLGICLKRDGMMNLRLLDGLSSIYSQQNRNQRGKIRYIISSGWKADSYSV